MACLMHGFGGSSCGGVGCRAAAWEGMGLCDHLRACSAPPRCALPEWTTSQMPLRCYSRPPPARFRISDPTSPRPTSRHLPNTPALQAEYARRAVVMLRAAQRELTGLAEWGVPSAGMFLWLRLLGEADAAEVWQELCEESVIMIPGKPMHWR